MNSEFLFTDTDFSKIRTLIHRRAGIALGEQKRQMVYSRLSRRLRELGMGEFASYLSMLEARPDGDEWQAFINSLTTNLTSFFREAHHFPVLADFVRQRRNQPIEIWCAAASTGEEPYSIAMTLIETLGERAAGGARVIATDIDTAVLAKASAGVFSLEQARLSPERLKRFFNKGTGSNAGKVRIRPEVAALVKFSQLNLLDRAWPVKDQVDAIFCRNVMIYFDKPTQKAVLERLALQLKPGGLLFAGHSENASLVSQAFRPLGQTVYELAANRRSSLA